jgi:hypothetical protein
VVLQLVFVPVSVTGVAPVIVRSTEPSAAPEPLSFAFVVVVVVSLVDVHAIEENEGGRVA